MSSGDSESYVASETGRSSAILNTPPQTPHKTRKMVMEVVIPIPKRARERSPSVGEGQATTARRVRACPRGSSPARSDSSVSLGTYWHVTPVKKRPRNPGKPRTKPKREQTKSGKRRIQVRGPRGATIESTLDRPVTATRPRPALSTLPPLPPSAPTEFATADSDSHPRIPSASPFKSRSQLTPKASGIRINLESARLETIQAQESARGCDTYEHTYWSTPASGTARTRLTHALNTPAMSTYSESSTPLYAFSTAGSSTGPGTRERDIVLERHNWTPPPPVSAPQRVPTAINIPTPVTEDRPRLSFNEVVETEFDTVSPGEANKLFRLGLQTALGKFVEQYGFPMDKVSKLYRSKGCLEETERVLKKLRATEDELREMETAAFGNHWYLD
ncbi:hypothetical protein RhiXN_06995 [Rhizoctonia solani]|uniref:Uncharacterized protein n=1 Tax=Rhizoctonia solani TaxID=456999 RepID=A0A8H8T060_9AGAM|nr:uncharacterized protein RhiXN_06995 [Rhizoctonia solani]QRW25046.1 hypothetical protein RhiXN_06995 [Rhizoctonia solani]